MEAGPAAVPEISTAARAAPLSSPASCSQTCTKYNDEMDGPGHSDYEVDSLRTYLIASRILARLDTVVAASRSIEAERLRVLHTAMSVTASLGSPGPGEAAGPLPRLAGLGGHDAGVQWPQGVLPPPLRVLRGGNNTEAWRNLFGNKEKLVSRLLER